MIHRLPAIGISAFSAIIVATPIAMLLNAVTGPAADPAAAAPSRPVVAPVEIVLKPALAAEPAPVATDDGGEPVSDERTEKAE